jgi:murein DD-endopeptidase MepM/ murein hydrolase activator NlpD
MQWYGTTNRAYNNNSEYRYAQGLHAGIDQNGVPGTPVHAGVSGTVYKKNRTAFGPRNITIRVTGSHGTTWDVIYGHLTLDSVEDWQIGHRVYPDTVLGKLACQPVKTCGNTHLHFEIRDTNGDGKFIFNPLGFMYEEDISTLNAIAAKQSKGTNSGSVTFYEPSTDEDYLTNYPDPRRQPLVVHILDIYAKDYKYYWTK